MREREELNRLEQEIGRKNAELAYLSDRQKILTKEVTLLNRRERTHRLCMRGGMLERYLPRPGEWSDEQVLEALRLALSKPVVQVWLDAHAPDETPSA